MSSVRLGNTGGYVGPQKYADRTTKPLFGRAIDGNVSSAAAAYNINTGLAGPGSGGRAVDAPKVAVTAFTANSVTVSGSLTDFRVGDICLLINLQGSATRFSRVGTWERLCVSALGASTVTFTTNVLQLYGEDGVGTPTNSDLTGQKIMLLRVPEYGSVALSGTATLTCDAFDGTIGGIVAIICRTLSVTGSASINADSKGYRGSTTAGESYKGSGTGGGQGSVGNTGLTDGGLPGSGGGGAAGAGGGAGGSYGATGPTGGAGGGGGGGGSIGSPPSGQGPLTGSPASGSTGGAGASNGGPILGRSGGSGGAGGTGNPAYGQSSADTGINLFMGSGGGGTNTGTTGSPGLSQFPGRSSAGGTSGTSGALSTSGAVAGGIVMIWAENLVAFRGTANGANGTAGTPGFVPSPTSSSNVGNPSPPNTFNSGGGGGGGSGGGGGGAGGSLIMAAANVTAIAVGAATGGSGGPGGPGAAGDGGQGPFSGTGGGPGGAGAAGLAGGAGAPGRVVVRTFTPILASTPDAVGGYAPLAPAFKGTL